MTDYIKEWKQEEVKQRRSNREINIYQYFNILKTLMSNKIIELIQNYNQEGIKEQVVKMVDKHFDTLQAKVEKKIGKIETIYNITGSGYDYKFTGTDGECVIRLVNAGGYNIQCQHTRWIIR